MLSESIEKKEKSYWKFNFHRVKANGKDLLPHHFLAMHQPLNLVLRNPAKPMPDDGRPFVEQ